MPALQIFDTISLPLTGDVPVFPPAARPDGDAFLSFDEESEVREENVFLN